MSDSEEQLPAPVSQLLIKRLSDKARLPTRGSLLAAGYDLYRYGDMIGVLFRVS
jgi:dUTP pyrophosphatase